MGFIEDERRRKGREDLDSQRRSKALMEQQERERRQREASQPQREVSHEQKMAYIKARMGESKQHFEQSGLGGMIAELGRLGSHEEAIINDEFGDHHEVRIGLSDSDHAMRGVKVETTADGTITIKGDDSHGTTTLSKDKWQGKNGQKALEKALEKAYKHPEYRAYIPNMNPDGR